MGSIDLPGSTVALRLLRSKFQDNPLVKAPATTDANEESGMAVAIDVAEASNAKVRLQPNTRTKQTIVTACRLTDG